MQRLLITLYDIGPKRLLQRLVYESKKYINKVIPIYLLYNSKSFNPDFLDLHKELNTFNYAPSYLTKYKPNNIKFKFLNKTRELELPLKWNSSKWSRLWQFNLHYFDWSRSILEESIIKNEWSNDSLTLEYLIDNWIDSNKPGRGDGWNSYTLSLRIRNWIWIFRTCPAFINRKRVYSLWYQVCWLRNHPEECHGGNHWLENLITLVIGSLQFNEIRSKEIYKYSLDKLKIELKKQILSDGGHEERSASYHLLILDRLVELGCVLESVSRYRPIWLVQSIESMTKWLKLASISNKRLPQFNDYSINNDFDLNTIISFADSYLNKSNYLSQGFRSKLLSIYTKDIIKESSILKNNTFKLPLIVDLKDTGWVLLRPDKNWTVTFKSGEACPKHLPAHVHSDILSFDIFKNGIPIFISAGTSEYGNSKRRHYERSGPAHNILEIGTGNDRNGNEINWIEGVDVWGAFRAGKKSTPTYRNSKELEDGTLYTSGSYDTHRKYKAFHERSMGVRINSSNNLVFSLKDIIKTSKPIFVRQWWHLGVGIDDSLLEEIATQLSKNGKFKAKYINTYYSLEFGKIVKRRSLSITGLISPGHNTLSVNIIIR